MSYRRSLSLCSLSCLMMLTAGGGGCGGDGPAAKDPSKPATSPSAAPADVSAVAEPAGLVLVGRVSRPDEILRTIGAWTRLPLPGGAELVRSLSDAAVADAVDLTKPIDGAIALGGSKRAPSPVIALSVAVRSFDDAKAKLAAKHKLTADSHGQLLVEGITRGSVGSKGREEEEDEGPSCVLAHASSGARLVCGERDALDLLAPYLARTVTRQNWTSDVHVEITLGAVREPLTQVRAGLPFIARSILGTSSPALGQLIEAAVTELVDIVGDTDRMTLDAQIREPGIEAALKVDYVKATSVLARLATAHPERADGPPPAFLRLPADTDFATYGKGSDPKLFDHPRELLANVALESAEGAGMPEAERKAVRDLVVDRMLGLFTGPLVYGKGYDAASLDKALAARTQSKATDLAARDELDRVIAEQSLGWHLVKVTEPITKVGPVLKDWATLWNRPAFSKWAKQQASGKMVAHMRILPPPAGVALPKDAVHLEIVIPRADLEDAPAAPPRGASSKPDAPRPTAKGKKLPVKPLVLHVLAVPDQGGTWLAFGMDGKLLAQKAAASLEAAPESATLAKSPASEAVRDIKGNSAVLATVRGFLVFTAVDHEARTPFALLGSLPGKGQTPIVFAFAAQPSSPSAAGGSALATFKLPRAAIEDIVKVALSTH